MTTRKWLALGATLFSVIFIWYLIDHKIISLRQEEASEKSAQQMQPQQPTDLEGKINAEVNIQQNNTVESTDDSESHRPPTSDVGLKRWIQQESKKLDLKDRNPQDTEKRLRLFAGQLRQNQLEQLLSTALNTTAPANEKVLSTYLMTLNSTEDSSENMKKISLEKLSISGDVQPHTVDEVKRGQELALKYMAIDELAQRARKNVADYNRLVSIANSAPDREVRDYAERKLKEIGP